MLSGGFWTKKQGRASAYRQPENKECRLLTDPKNGLAICAAIVDVPTNEGPPWGGVFVPTKDNFRTVGQIVGQNAPVDVGFNGLISPVYRGLWLRRRL